MPTTRICAIGQALYPGCKAFHKQANLNLRLKGNKPSCWVFNVRPGSTVCSADVSSIPTTAKDSRSTSSPGLDTDSADFAAAGTATSGAPRICILGGGFGGLYTAVRLQNLLWPQGKKPLVTLIDKNERFVFKPLLYEIVNGTAKKEEVAPPFIKLLSPYAINFIQGNIVLAWLRHLNHTQRKPETYYTDNEDKSLHSFSRGRVVLKNGGDVPYDWLVLSMGSESSTLGIEGVKELAVLFNTIDDALQTQREVEMLEQAGSSTVIVVGSGPAGVELATTVAARLGNRTNVNLVSTGPEILKGAPATHRDAAEQVLRQKQVSVIRNRKVTKLTESNQMGAGMRKRRVVEMMDKADQTHLLEADLVLWTTGSQPSNKADSKMDLPFPCNDKGALKTYDTLQTVGDSHVFALGDLASSAVEGQQLDVLPATAQVAFQQADYAAWNIWAAIHNRPLLPFRYQHLGDMMSLGITDGAVTLPIQLPRELSNALQSSIAAPLLKIAGVRLGDGVEKGITLEGSVGALIRRAAYLYRQPTSEHRWEVGSNWFQQALEQAGSAFNRPVRR